MNWARAVERNSEALQAIIAALFAMLGLAGGGAAVRIPRALHRAVLRVLRPAESAMRRLIVIAARGLAVAVPPSRPMPRPPVGPAGQSGRDRLSFPLCDPRKRFFRPRRIRSRFVPRVRVFGDPLVPAWWAQPPRAAAAPADDGLIDARRVAMRLEALKRALDDLPRQARRLARLQARRQNVPGLRPKRRCGRGGRPAIASAPFTRSTACSPNATASPAMRWPPTRPRVC